MSKLSLAEIWRDHHATLVDVRTGSSRPADYGALYLPGILSAGALFVSEMFDGNRIAFAGGALDGMLAAAGLLAAFFFGLSVTLLDKAMDFDLSRPSATPAAVERSTRMQQVAANTAFASLIAGLTTAVLVVAITVHDLADIAGSLAVGGMVTVLTTGALVLRRVYNETKDRLRNVRTGVSADESFPFDG